MEECAHRSSMPSFPAKVNRGITPERKKWSSSKLNLAFLWQCLAVRDYNPTPKSYYICRWLVSMFKLITQLIVSHVLESKTLFFQNFKLLCLFMVSIGFYINLCIWKIDFAVKICLKHKAKLADYLISRFFSIDNSQYIIWWWECNISFTKYRPKDYQNKMMERI